MNTLISHFSSLWNNYFNYSPTDYSSQDIPPGSVITVNNNSNLYTVIGTNADNDLVCSLPPDYIGSKIISKTDIQQIIKSQSNLDSNKKTTFAYK